MIKNFIFSILFCAVSICAMAQDKTVTHVVQRGETIESIAKQYNVSVDDIYHANPNAEGLMYAGLKLIIPVSDSYSNQQTSTSDSSNNTIAYSQNNSTDAENNSKTAYTETTEGKWECAFEIGFGFIEKHTFMYEATLGANYNFPYNLYAGARIGYNSSNFHFSESSTSNRKEGNLHFIEIPLEFGYKLKASDKFSIAPFASFIANIGLTGKFEEGVGKNKVSTDMEIGGKFAMDARLGIRLNLSGFVLSGSYHFPLNDNQKLYFSKDAFPEVSLGMEI